MNATAFAVSDNSTNRHDIAIVELKPDALGRLIAFSEFADRACLPTADVIPNTSATILGWGMTTTFGNSEL